ncbi:(2Fe-2S) ferredoxin domain-containing protein [Allocoleopsis franciscana]|uniref:NADH:ubiquinone oxidoreductase 24 kD subunit n=1 Tax=Allocoleopsis franciscana PCC 7113 TaxID=1173027 RepID=K9WLS3_9CYAN|nr:NAD(P)H-dependent oxidoreductase subunit E [Allocoleopsis franciscana]AFZ21113.1 NADH:ubiquinone oxidoreductase 24 kD subunit [Allocoleopsis franciscana PCC 7113]
MIRLIKEGKVSPFYLEGRFIGFVGDVEEKPKRIRVATAEGERYIKLSKELRYSMRGVLQPGDWVEIFGELKLKDKTGELKLKASRLKVTAPALKGLVKEDTEEPGALATRGKKAQNSSTNSSQNLNHKPSTPAPKGKACVMVCQKSSCRKRGADKVCQALTESLHDHGLEDQVAIKGTGCMKQCKQGPCVVVMPDKSRYTGLAPQEIPKLVEKHFAAKLKPEGSKPELSPVS